MFMGSCLTLLVPISARSSYIVLIICRFLNGIFHGMVWPAISDIFIRWVPVAEKSRLIGFASAGNNLGNIVALPLGSYLCVNGFDNGWGSIFYIIGLIFFT
jgi:MFS transporter, ACS family, solute carrier family 17 (sodium-dependent inorganic phosphate cotransporter), member 5